MDRLPVGVSAASGRPYDEQIVTQIAGLIGGGHLRPGCAVAPAAKLAAQLRISLDMARRASARLEQFGLILRRQDGSARVAERAGEALRAQALGGAHGLLQEAICRARSPGLPMGSCAP